MQLASATADWLIMKRFALPLAGVVAVAIALFLWFRTGPDDPAADDDPAASAGAAGPSASTYKSPIDLPEDQRASVAGLILNPDKAPVPNAQACFRYSRQALQALVTQEPRCVDADSTGRYQIEGIVPGTIAVFGQAPGFRARQHVHATQRGHQIFDFDVGVGADVANIDVTLLPGAVEVTGYVEDLSGGVIEGASVTAQLRNWGGDPRDADTVARTDAEGRFSIWTPPGQVSVRARAAGYGSRLAAAAAPGTEVRIRLTPASAVEGVVVDAESGAPIPGMEVTASNAGRGFGVTDQNGFFRIDDLQPGRLTVQARGESHFAMRSGVRVAFADTATVRLEAHPATTFTGQVLVKGDATEKQAEPCPAGHVMLEEKSRSEQHRQATDTDGRARFLGLMPGTYQVSVFCEGYLSPEAPEALTIVEKQKPTDGRWVLDAGRSLRGRVVDATGKPATGLTVRARSTASNNMWGQSGSTRVTSEDGSWTVYGLMAGPNTVLASRGFGGPQSERQQVEIPESGEAAEVVIEMPAAGSVTGQVLTPNGGPVKGADIVLIGETNRGVPTRTNDAGQFELDEVKAGEYRVLARRNDASLRPPGTREDDYRGEAITVVADTPTDIEIVVDANAGSIRGRVVDNTGAPVSDAFVSATRQDERAGASKARTRSRARFSWGNWGSEPELTDAEGYFALDDLDEGEYTVRAFHKDGGDAIVEDIALGGQVELTLPRLAALRGQVVVPGAKAPTRFVARLNDAEQGISLRQTFFMTDGSFEFEALTAGNYELIVESGDGDARVESIEVAEGGTVEGVEVELASKVRIEGRLINEATGEPVQGMRAIVSNGGGFSFGPGGKKDDPEVSDANGKFVLADAPAEARTVTLMPLEFEKSPFGWVGIPVRIPEGSSTYDMGDVGLIPSDVGLRERAGDFGINFEDVKPGAEAEDRRHVIASVREGGPAKKGGLSPGDEIVAVAGRDVTGLNAWKLRPSMRVKPGSSVAFKLSDGRTVTLVAAKALD